ncbi:enoyl-CoA hydratase/isomerase family protein [Jatrophihabitans endophyticus]|uniref:enoyl-CoA hydratase/isomerase family protein n=1 Tax=Jatrophihabitans endophyticus TaxID=1206085 RepID=UPI0019EE7082|nr:enoyl-CoA hydratase/isomerase family protein [Jatrophihabitans endophyticus]MBE7190504.1 enoyl-CoA hydratase/isomerase family protein [Jatrophihabitans endophyticus]
MTDFPYSITLERDGYVAHLRFASEHPANVFTLPMLKEMSKHVADIAAGDDVRVLVIEGRDTMFSGGADLQSILDMDADTYLEYVETEYALFRAIEVLPILTVAVLRGGSCVGNAAEIALACDFRVAADSVRIGWPEIHVGFVAPSQRLARFVGIGVAKEILFTGRLLKAPQARELGLLSSVVPADEVGEAVSKLLEQLAGRAPVSVRVTKAGIERAFSFPDENPGLEVKAAAESYATDDCREGATAILERRTPVFVGH